MKDLAQQLKRQSIVRTVLKQEPLHYAISAHMQRSGVLPYTPNGVALGTKSRYATLPERCICEPCL